MSPDSTVQSRERDNKASPSEFKAEAAYKKLEKHRSSKRHPIERTERSKKEAQQGTTKTSMTVRWQRFKRE